MATTPKAVKRYAVTLDEPTYKRLRAYCDPKGITIIFATRQAVGRYLAAKDQRAK